MTNVKMSEEELRRWFALSDYEFNLWLRIDMKKAPAAGQSNTAHTN